MQNGVKLICVEDVLVRLDYLCVLSKLSTFSNLRFTKRNFFYQPLFMKSVQRSGEGSECSNWRFIQQELPSKNPLSVFLGVRFPKGEINNDPFSGVVEQTGHLLRKMMHIKA